MIHEVKRCFGSKSTQPVLIFPGVPPLKDSTQSPPLCGWHRTYLPPEAMKSLVQQSFPSIWLLLCFRHGKMEEPEGMRGDVDMGREQGMEKRWEKSGRRGEGQWVKKEEEEEVGVQALVEDTRGQRGRERALDGREGGAVAVEAKWENKTKKPWRTKRGGVKQRQLIEGEEDIDSPSHLHKETLMAYDLLANR